MNDTRPAEILSTVQGGVTVPLLRAAVAGFFISLPVLILTAAAAVNGYEFARRWWWACWLLAWTITQVGWWLYDERGRKRMQEAVIYAIEMSVGADLNQDGEIGVPPEENVRVQIERQNENNAWEGTFTKLPVKRDLAVAFASRVIEGDGKTDVRTWTTGKFHIFTRDEYDAFVGWLDSQGGVDWKSEHDHRVGWTLSDDGREILGKFL